MASGNPNMDSGGNNGTLQRGYSSSNSSARDYDGLKQQCDKAMSELTLLRRQHSDTARRCDQAMKELEYYRGQHRAAMNQLEASAQESGALRNKYSELAGEKQRFEREVQDLRAQLSDLHCQQGEDYSNPDNGNADTGLYVSLSRRSESDSCETLRKRYDELLAAHSNAVAKLERTQEEASRLSKQCEELSQERNNAVRERNGLKQQCTAAIRQWDMALRERNEYRDALSAAQAQREEAAQELSQAMAVRMKASKDIKRLTDERNAAMQEYALIMSERDTVHKEMEKLSDDLTQALKKTKALEADNKQLTEEKQTLSYQMETLRREISSALHDRDKALKECNDLREKFGGYRQAIDGSRDVMKSRMECLSGPGENATRKEIQGVNDARSLAQGRRPDTLDQATQELESLRKGLDDLRGELTEAQQEAEVSKRRRDWAFSERDKIVLERESIRTLCDRLRKERDRAVSDLAAALRDSDEVKKQRNEACRELSRLKDAVETRLEKESRVSQQFRAVGHHSRDSAIDADIQEWETEILEIDLSGLASDSSLGLELVGGRDDPTRPNDTGIYVASIVPGSIADGKLKINDCIAKVNHLDCGCVSRKVVLEAVRASLPRAHLVVRRRRQNVSSQRYSGSGGTGLRTTQLAAARHGLTLETGVYISKISPGSSAAKEGTLAVGDRVLSINNKSMDSLKTSHEAMSILNDDRCDIIIITTLSNRSLTHSNSSNLNSCFVPTKEISHHHKMVNSCSQTEDIKHYDSDLVENRKYIVPSNFSHGSVYHVSKGSQEKNNSGAWEIIREKIRGRRHSKDRNRSEEKKKYRNSSPNTLTISNTFDHQEQDAINELDQVINEYRPKSGGNMPSVLKKTKNRNNKDLESAEKNGGTWPKVRSNNIIQNPTGTIICSKTRERLPLSILLNDAPQSSMKHDQSCCSNNRNSNPIPNSVEENLRHITYKSEDSGNLHSDSINYSLKNHQMEKELLNAYYGKKASSVKPSSKYPSDSESTAGPDSLTNVAGNVRPHSQVYGAGPRYPHFNPHPHPHPHLPRLPSSQSGESFCFEPPHWHVHSPSEGGIPWQHRPAIPCEGGTFPRKRENQRFRIPSNPSVAGSIERTSERASPMPTFHVEFLSSGISASRSNEYWGHRPAPGDIRRVHIDKSSEPLGIQIDCLKSGGVFVSTVSEHSLASQVGLQIGDQLLEVCGINMRSATYQLAASVLRQCGNSITMLVQYSPEKYPELDRSASSSSSDEEDGDNEHDEMNRDNPNHEEPDRDERDAGDEEEELTPRNTPRLRQRKISATASGTGTLTRSQISQAVGTLQRQNLNSVVRNSPDDPTRQVQNLHEPRFLFIETRKCSNLGISLVGGNAVGIFVHSVQPDSLAHNAGLRTGDQILEYNGADLRHATAEEAAYELAKPADKVTVLAHYNLDRYNEIKDKPGDSLYVRCGFDRGGTDSTGTDGSIQLRFNKDDVLYVDNTMYNGVPGHWRAWRLDSEGRRHQCGIIPSKYKVEEELLLRRSFGDLEGRGTITARRSFFKRFRHTRGGSGTPNRDSKELATFNNVAMGWYSDSGMLHEDTTLCSYQRVERLDYPVYRPVLVLGPLADCVAEKLVTDFPDCFRRCPSEPRHCPQSALDQELNENLIIDYRRKGSYFECTTVAAVKSICDKGLHCILDVSVTSVERLHRHQIYPIVLLIKFKSTKQIKEVKDTRYPLDKVSAKAAKEMYEHGQKLEMEYKHLISAVIPAGVNVAYMCTQVKAAVDAEQKKSVWVPIQGI